MRSTMDWAEVNRVFGVTKWFQIVINHFEFQCQSIRLFIFFFRLVNIYVLPQLNCYIMFAVLFSSWGCSAPSIICITSLNPLFGSPELMILVLSWFRAGWVFPRGVLELHFWRETEEEENSGMIFSLFVLAYVARKGSAPFWWRLLKFTTLSVCLWMSYPLFLFLRIIQD